MKTSKILHLDRYQNRRADRLAKSVALYGADPDRREIAACIGQALEAIRGDRGGLVWVEEYGEGLVHPHCVVDLVHDRPRRDFPLEPLQVAWSETPPMFIDTGLLGEDFQAFVGELDRHYRVVSLGIDGLRAWFLVLEARPVHGGYSEEAVRAVMHLAGRCAAVVLHEDIAAGKYDDVPMEQRPFEVQRNGSFAGWTVLKDLDDSEDDDDDADEVGGRIGSRFVVARFVRSVVDDALVVDEASLASRFKTIWKELAKYPEKDEERKQWIRALGACQDKNWPVLAQSLLDWGESLERDGQLNGALELYRTAYDVACGSGAVEAGIDASRFCGRTFRKLAQWDDSLHWYESAVEMARVAELKSLEAVSLDGMGNVYRDEGNFPRARELYEKVLDIGEAINDLYSVGSAHLSLMVLESESKNLDSAAWHGWRAFNSFSEEDQRLGTLLDLGTVFVRLGFLESAEDAYRVVSLSSPSIGHLVMSKTGLATVAAVKGDRQQFLTMIEEIRDFSQGSLASWVEGQVRLEIGGGFLRLGMEYEAADWLRNAEEFARLNGLGKVLHDVEAVLEKGLAGLPEELQTSRVVPVAPGLREAVNQVRSELSALRSTLSVA